MSSSVVAVYFSDIGKKSYPFHNESYFESYKYLAGRLQEVDVEMIIVRGDSYAGNGLFDWGWKFDNDGRLQKINTKIQANIIWNRDDKNTIPFITDCTIINNPDFDQLCLDKSKTAELFPLLSPLTEDINSYGEFLEVLERWGIDDHERLVLKKNFGTEGRDIFIKLRNEITKDTYFDWSNVIVQEFCDSSDGITDLVEGMHDIRVILIEGKIIYAYVREPAVGKYKANLSQGGSYFYIDPNTDILKDLILIIKKLDKRLSNYKYRMYGADFFKCKGDWKLIELNSRPGIAVPGKDFTKNYYDELVALFLMAIKNDNP